MKTNEEILTSIFRINTLEDSVKASFKWIINSRGMLHPPFIFRLNIILEKYHSQESFNVAFLCQRLHLCPMQVNRKIKKHSGLSIGKYIQYYRIYKAIELMYSTENSINRDNVYNRLS